MAKTDEKKALDLLRKKKPYTHTVLMCMDSTLTERRNRLQVGLDTARTTYGAQRRLPDDNPMKMEASAKLADLEDEVRKLDEAIAANTVEFVFRSMGRRAYQQLGRDHPPSDEEKQEFAERQKRAGKPANEQKGPRLSDQTYPPAVVAACLVEPKVDPGEIEGWFNSSDGDDAVWNAAELNMLLIAAENACNSVSLSQ